MAEARNGPAGTPAGQTRRTVLAAGAALAAAPAFASEDGPSLAVAAHRAGLLCGAAVEPGGLDGDAAFAELVRRQSAVLVPENAMKWDALRPAPEVFDFARADRLMTIARDQQAAVHGHTLIWHEAMPGWLTHDLDARSGRGLLTQHIGTVVGRYAGRIRSWDVVNEAVERNDHRPDGLRISPWLRALGPDYLDLAFASAHAADPRARLALSDYGLEYDDQRWMVEKRGAMLLLLEQLRSRGTPIHALAIQGHLDGARPPAFGAGLSGFLQDVAALGLEIYVTELDVNDQTLSGSPGQRDAVSGACYRAFLDVVCEQPALRMVNTWGLSDRYTSKRSMFPRADGAAPRPLPFDDRLAAKPAAFAMIDSFNSRARAGL